MERAASSSLLTLMPFLHPFSSMVALTHKPFLIFVLHDEIDHGLMIEQRGDHAVGCDMKKYTMLY
jgi:hypothetical protein